MTTLKNRYEFLLPLIAGFCCLILGPALVINDQPLIQLVGSCVLLWVPGCAYLTRRGYRARLARPMTVDLEPVPEQLDSEAMAFLVLRTGGSR